jgi:hypothetical protein
MKRRDFIKLGSCGIAAFAVGGIGLPAFLRPRKAMADSHAGFIELTMQEVDAQMVDRTVVYMWAFSSPEPGPRIPGPFILALEGETIRLRIRNEIEHGGFHGFSVPGVFDSGPILFGESVDVEFPAPASGSYFYLDPFNAPVNRVMGLHGVLIVMPSPIGNNTPYSNPTPNVQRLFNDLGSLGWSEGLGSAHFPGHPWDSDRTWIWAFNSVDPDKNDAMNPDLPGSVDFMPAAQFEDGYLPRYFTLNGKSGFFAAGHSPTHEEHAHQGLAEYDIQRDIAILGNVGQPAVIRALNAGIATHSLHPHGNHFYLLSENGVVRNNVWWLDTWSLEPLGRKDLLLPFMQPPEIPPAAWPPVDENFPFQYTMHCHTEMSQTAAGGNYPQGNVTHWQMEGPIDPNDAVIFVDRADLRVQTGTLMMEGRCSTPAITLDVHPGDGALPEVAHFLVGGDGLWSFRGRGVRFLASRKATIMFHDPGPPEVVRAARTVPLRLR